VDYLDTPCGGDRAKSSGLFPFMKFERHLFHAFYIEELIIGAWVGMCCIWILWIAKLDGFSYRYEQVE